MDVPLSSAQERKIVKLAILGDGMVGKTSILRHLKGLPFDSKYRMTVGADFVIKRLNHHQYDVTLQLFDVGGQPQFSYLRSRYYGQSQGVVIVFDLMKRSSYENIPTWLEEVMEVNQWKFIPLLLIGNKEDLAKDENYEVKQEEIDSYVDVLQHWGEGYDPEFKVLYQETSAKTGHNVENCFKSILDILL